MSNSTLLKSRTFATSIRTNGIANLFGLTMT